MHIRGNAVAGAIGLESKDLDLKLSDHMYVSTYMYNHDCNNMVYKTNSRNNKEGIIMLLMNINTTWKKAHELISKNVNMTGVNKLAS